jgi:hypothetical protein
MVRDHVLRGLEPGQEAARGFDESIGIASTRLTTKNRSEVGIYFIGETRAIEYPVPCIGPRGIAELDVAARRSSK